MVFIILQNLSFKNQFDDMAFINVQTSMGKAEEVLLMELKIHFGC